MNEVDGILSFVKYITCNEPNGNKIIIRSKIETIILKRNVLQGSKIDSIRCGLSKSVMHITNVD